MKQVESRPFLSPERPALGRAQALLGNERDPARAWQRLVDEEVVPRNWLDHSRRRFVLDPGDGSAGPTRDPAIAPLSSHPQTALQCALFAADVRAMLAAESAARVLSARLEPWGNPPYARIVWWSIPQRHYARVSSDTRPNASYALAFAFGALFDTLRDDEKESLPRSFLGHAQVWSSVWAGRSNEGIRVPEGPMFGHTFSQLPNPFEPLARIEATGYATLEYASGMGSATGNVVLVSCTDD